MSLTFQNTVMICGTDIKMKKNHDILVKEQLFSISSVHNVLQCLPSVQSAVFFRIFKCLLPHVCSCFPIVTLHHSSEEKAKRFFF